MAFLLGTLTMSFLQIAEYLNLGITYIIEKNNIISLEKKINKERFEGVRVIGLSKTFKALIGKTETKAL